MDALTALDRADGRNWTLLRGDCVDVVAQLPDASVDLCLYSPPFANLYTYSDTPRDMGNAVDDAQFLAHYARLVPHLHRVLRPGRLCVVHTKDCVNYRGRDGMAGLRDFPGDVIRAHVAAGFAYHSRVTIWRSPVTEMQKTKAHGLLYKQLRADSSFSRVGMPEYLIAFRRWPHSKDDEAEVRPVTHMRDDFALERWQEWASPVWMDIDHMDTLNVTAARDAQDERHMCPLSLDVIERALTLWSNPGDVVLSPFAGVGSEGVGTLRLGRKFVGVELKDTYYERAAINLRQEEGAEQVQLFAASP